MLRDQTARQHPRDPRDLPGAEVIDLATRRVMPVVAQQRRGSDGLQLAAGVAVVALLGALTFWSMGNARQSRPAAQPQVPVQSATTPLRQPPVVLQPIPPQPGAHAPGQPVTGPVASVPGANPYAAPAVVFDASALPFAQPAPSGPTGVGGPAVAAGPSGNGNEDFANRLGGVGGSAATATASINPKTTVAQGTLIPAVLETAIDTDVPGFVRAVVSSDVRSFDGSRVLVPRSSRLVGQYRSGMQAGQKRAYVIWQRLVRPDGVTVNLASPGVTFSGEAGLSGRVDTHFFERFGSAMLLSVVGGLTMGSGTGAAIVLGGTQSAAAAAVGQTGNIGPTVRVRQGEPVRVFTARDLDFSKVSGE